MYASAISKGESVEMKNLIIVKFPAAKGKFDELEAALKVILPETRAFEGCRSLDVYQEQGTETFTLVEDWESFDHYDRYLQWRSEGALPQLLDELLEGGLSAQPARIQKFQARPDV